LIKINFELILVQGERQGSSFSLLHVDIHFFPAAFVEEAVFSPSCVLGSFVEEQLAVDTWVYVWIFYSDPLIVPIPCCFYCYGSVV
jgi:hypothetical protein